MGCMPWPPAWAPASSAIEWLKRSRRFAAVRLRFGAYGSVGPAPAPALLVVLLLVAVLLEVVLLEVVLLVRLVLIYLA